jgi:SAM-dependent methyltransferase
MNISARTSELSPVAAQTSFPASISVAIVIVTHNQAHFLAEAIESAVAQSRPADEILVVDDGSTDNPEEVVARYPDVRLHRQDNLMLSAARNTGLRKTVSDFVLFLDADDKLHPRAIGASLDRFALAPESGFVFGGYQLVDATGNPISKVYVGSVDSDAYRSFLERNCVKMHGTVLYRREVIEEAGGFDTGLRRCEDYDLYLRIAERYPIACHGELVANYRRHGSNMSLDYSGMLESVLAVMEKQRLRAAERPEWQAAWRSGATRWRDAACGMAMGAGLAAARQGKLQIAARGLGFALKTSPMSIPRAIARRVIKRSRQSGTAPMLKGLQRFFRGRPIGPIWLGSISSTKPVDSHFGFGRGTPVDRHYISTFLEARRGDIKGRVLEIGDNSYTTQFGGSDVAKSDVLHVHAGNPYATIVGDLARPHVLPEAVFDCLVITQTLHCIYDIELATRSLHDALKPGGIALVTLPCVSQIDRGEWGNTWYWGVAPAAALHLFEKVFGKGNAAVEVFGNVYAATTFLQGLALEEVSSRKLMIKDEAYPVVVGIRAVRAK